MRRRRMCQRHVEVDDDEEEVAMAHDAWWRPVEEEVARHGA